MRTKTLCLHVEMTKCSSGGGYHPTPYMGLVSRHSTFYTSDDFEGKLNDRNSYKQMKWFLVEINVGLLLDITIWVDLMSGPICECFTEIIREIQLFNFF